VSGDKGAGGGASSRLISRLRWPAIALAVVLVFAAGIGLRQLASAGSHEAEPTGELESNVAVDLSTRPAQAPRAALVAVRAHPSVAAELAMIDVAAADKGIERVVDTGTGEATAALVLERDLITCNEEGEVELWRRADGAMLGEVSTPAPIVAFGDASVSAPYVAAVDRDGALELVDISDPSRPRVLPLGHRLAAGEKPLAVAFSKEVPGEVVAVGSGGEVLRVDLTTDALVSRGSLNEVHGEVPWVRGAALKLVAAKFLPEVFADEEGLLVGTAEGGVADVDIGRGQGKTVLEPGVAPGRILSLDRMEYGENEVVVGTTRGLVVEPESGSYIVGPVVEFGLPVPAVALEPDGEGRWTGNATGMVEPEMEHQPYSGLPVRAFDVGYHGTAAIDPEGKVSVLGGPGVGISMAAAEGTSAVTFDPKGDLLIASGYDPNHTEKIKAIRPRPPLPSDEYTEEDEVRDYEPDPAWWSGAEDPEAFYVNDVAADDEYVVAAGQDPFGKPAVVVWDAASGRPLRELDLGTDGIAGEVPTLISKVMLLPGRHQIAAYSVAQESIAVWSTETWELEESIPVGAAGDISVSPDESTIAVVGLADEEAVQAPDEQPVPISFVDLDAGRMGHTVEVKGATATAFAPDGSSLAVAYGEDMLQLRSPDGREAIGKPIELSGEAKELAWRPTGGLLAASLEHDGIVFVDPATGAVSKSLPYEEDRPTLAVDWSADGDLLAAQTGELAEDGDHYETDATEVWNLGAAAMRRRMCELAACGRDDEGGAAGPPESVAALGPIALVFRHEGDLYAAGADGDAAPIGQLPEYPQPPPSYEWSAAGFAWSGPQEIGAILPGAARPRTWPCGCAGVAWDGGEILSVATDGAALVHVDPDTGSVRTTPIHGVPPYDPNLVGIVGGHPIVAAYDSAPDPSTSGRLFEIGPGGQAVELARKTHGIFVADEPSSSPDTLALVSNLSGGACFSSDGIVVVSARAHGKVVVERPPAPPAGEFPQVRSVQVAADGSVSAAFAPIACNSEGLQDEHDSIAERYVLSGHRWRPTGETGFDVQAVGDGTATLRRGEKLGDPGCLVLSVGGREVEVDPAAEDLVAAP
jgi:hypothetical protein